MLVGEAGRRPAECSAARASFQSLLHESGYSENPGTGQKQWLEHWSAQEDGSL